MFHFASKGGYYLSAAFIQERPLIEHIRYMHAVFQELIIIISCHYIIAYMSEMCTSIQEVKLFI